MAGTANNLLPVSTSSGSGDGTLTATTSYTYDSIGNRLTVDGPLAGAGDTTRTRYDVLRRIIGVVGPDPDGSGSLKYRAQRLTYNADSQITLAEAGTVNSQSDADWANFASLQQVTTSYDSNARKTKDVVSAPSTSTTLAVTQYSYDNLGRTQCVAQRMNSSVWGTQTSGCTPNTSGSAGPDRIQRTSYNGASQVTSVELGVGTSVASTSASTGYTANGQLSYLTDGMGNKTTFEYDGFDRLLKTRYPSPTQGSGTSSTTDYQQANYDSRSNVTSLRLRDGQSVAMTYDNLSRLTLRDMPGTEPDITYGYDLLSRMTSASQTGNALSFTYDALSRNLTQVGPLGTMSYQYDLAGRRTRVTWPDALYVAYDYDLLNEMTAVRENGATSGVGVLATYTYNDLGFRTAQTGGNGTSTSYAPDALSRLTQLSLDASGTSSDLTLGFTYNPASQIATRTANNDAYAWTGAVSSTKSYTANGLNQYLTAGGVSPTYDTKGNLTNDGSGSYTYSSMNMLVSATVGSTTTALAYDPLARLYQTAGASTIRLLYDGQNLVGEYNTSGTLLRRYVPGAGIDQPVLWYEGSGTTDRRWLHADERGSVIATSNGSAVVTAINAYDEWGVPKSGNVGRYQYTGQTWLSEVGLYNYKARFYNQRLGRFMQTDPAGQIDNPNLYSYSADDPQNKLDPTGLSVSYGSLSCQKEVKWGEDGPSCVPPIFFNIDLLFQISGGGLGGASETTLDTAESTDIVVTAAYRSGIVVNLASQKSRSQCQYGTKAARAATAIGYGSLAHSLFEGLAEFQKASGYLKVNGIALNLASGGATVAASVQRGEPIDVAYVRATTPILLSYLGGLAGGTIGGAGLGLAGTAVAPGVGTTIGTGTGVFTGTLTGSYVGDRLGEVSAERYAQLRGYGGC